MLIFEFNDLNLYQYGYARNFAVIHNLLSSVHIYKHGQNILELCAGLIPHKLNETRYLP